MSEPKRWGPRIVAAVVVVGAVLAIVHQSVSKRPTLLVPLAREHQERGAAMGMKPAAEAIAPTASLLRLRIQRGLYPPSDPELQLVHQALSRGWLFGYGKTGLSEQMALPHDEALARLRDFALTPYSDEGTVPTMEDGWDCAAPAVNELLDRADATLTKRGVLHGDDRMIGAWAVARRFARNDAEAGLAMTRTMVRAELRDPEFYSISPIGIFDWWDTWDGSESGATIRLLLLLDTVAAPREAIDEVRRLLVDEALRDDQQRWLMEAASLERQSRLAVNARTSEPSVDSDKVAWEFGRWVGFQAARPLVVAGVEDFLGAWHDRDATRLEETGDRLRRFSEQKLGPDAAGMMAGWHEGPMPKEAWQYVVDCSGRSPRPARLEMARFMAAAMLFHRDTGAWPQTLDEVVPGYLPPGSIDPAGRWQVIAPAPLPAVVRTPEDSNFRRMLGLHFWANRRNAEKPEDLEPFAPPGEDLQRYAPRFIALAPRPLFTRTGPADPCSLGMRRRVYLHSPVYTEDAAGVRTEIRGFQADVATRLRSGEDEWTSCELVGLLRLPPAELLALIGWKAGS